MSGIGHAKLVLLDRLHFFIYALFRCGLFAGRVRRERRAISFVARSGGEFLAFQFNRCGHRDVRVVGRIVAFP